MTIAYGDHIAPYISSSTRRWRWARDLTPPPTAPGAAAGALKAVAALTGGVAREVGAAADWAALAALAAGAARPVVVSGVRLEGVGVEDLLVRRMEPSDLPHSRERCGRTDKSTSKDPCYATWRTAGY
jgi:hypothetical protein